MITKEFSVPNFIFGETSLTVNECDFDEIINMINEWIFDIESHENGKTGDTPKYIAIHYKDGTIFQRAFRTSIHCGHIDGEYFQKEVNSHQMSFVQSDIKGVKMEDVENELYIYGKYEIDDDFGELIFI